MASALGCTAGGASAVLSLIIGSVAGLTQLRIKVATHDATVQEGLKWVGADGA